MRKKFKFFLQKALQIESVSQIKLPPLAANKILQGGTFGGCHRHRIHDTPPPFWVVTNFFSKTSPARQLSLLKITPARTLFSPGQKW